MKPYVKGLGIFAALAAVLLLGFVCFSIGQSKGYRDGAALGHETGFVASLAALQRLRAGETAEAVDNLEAFCYASAVALLEQQGSRTKVVSVWFRDSLTKYLAEHSVPDASQYPTQQRLAELLSVNVGAAGAHK